MSRCFSNNNTISIKSSKEYTENKRNNAFFCNYANINHWTKQNISDENLKFTKKNIFLLNPYNQIMKANNHTNYLNLSKGLFNRKISIQRNQIKETDPWKKKKLLDILINRNLLTLKELSGNDVQEQKDNCKNDVNNDVPYGTQNNTYGMDYLDIKKKNIIFSNYSTNTTNLGVKNELMAKPLKKIIPYCFNLHGNNNLRKPLDTINNFGAGFEMFGDFKETVAHPLKSKKNPKFILSAVGINAKKKSCWEFNHKAFFWGGSGSLDTPKWKKGIDSLDITGIPETDKWSLILDIKFDGTLDDSVGKEFTDAEIKIITDEITAQTTEKEQKIKELGPDDAGVQFIDDLITDLKNKKIAMENKSIYLFRSDKNAGNDLDTGVRIRKGYITFAGLTFDKKLEQKTKKPLTTKFKKGYWYTIVFIFDNTESDIDKKIKIFRKATSTLNDDNWERLSTINTSNDKLSKIISIKDKIEFFKETYTSRTKTGGEVKTDTVATWWQQQNWISSGWVKNIYFTNNIFTIDQIKKFKKYEYNPI